MSAGADKFLFKRAAELRSHHTHAEEILWRFLRTKPFGFKFRRQHPYTNYILDFYCHALKLVIEVDGAIHNEETVMKNDIQRQQQLEAHGLKVVRFTNKEVEYYLETVIEKIAFHLQTKERLND